MNPCEKCPLHNREGVIPASNTDTPILDGVSVLFVGDVANNQDILHGPLSRYRPQLEQYFLNGGVDISKASYATAWRCSVDKKSLTNKETTAVTKCCSEYTKSFINYVKPRLIIPLGDIATNQITGKKGITKQRGTLIQKPAYGDAWIYPLFHPAVVEIDRAKTTFYQADITHVCGVIRNNYTPFDIDDLPVDYKEVDSIRSILDMRNIIAGIDCETQGVDFLSDDSVVISYSISVANKTGVNVVLWREIPKQYVGWVKIDKVITWDRKVRNKLQPTPVYLQKCYNYDQKIAEYFEFWQREDIIKVTANGIYERNRLHQLGMDTDLIKGHRLDVFSAAHSLDPDTYRDSNLGNIQRGFSPALADHKTAQGDKMNKKDMLSETLLDPSRYRHYSVADADSTRQTAISLNNLIKHDNELAKYYTKLVMPVTMEVLGDMEVNGITFDVEGLPEVTAEVNDFCTSEEAAIISMIPRKVLDAHQDAGLTLTRPDLKRDALYSKNGFGLHVLETTDTGLPSTDKKVLARLKSELDVGSEPYVFIDRLLNYGPYDKLRTTYLSSFGNAVRSDGKLHASYKKNGTATGRCSVKNPPVQTVPKRNKQIAKRIRKLMKASPGCVLVAADMSQAELRIIAARSGDKNLRQVFLDGRDVHTNTAGILLQRAGYDLGSMSEDDLAPWRTKAKPVNFGLSFGMLEKGFQAYSRDEYNVILTLEEAKTYRDGFFEGYPMLLPWHESEIEFARKYGYCRSMFGFIRRTPNITSTDFMKRSEDERKAINTPIQSTSNDYTLYSAHYARRRGVYDNKKSKLCMFVHDEVIFDVRENYLHKFVPLLIDCMENAPIKKEFGIDLGLPLVAEAKYGPNLAEMVKWYNGN